MRGVVKTIRNPTYRIHCLQELTTDLVGSGSRTSLLWTGSMEKAFQARAAPQARTQIGFGEPPMHIPLLPVHHLCNLTGHTLGLPLIHVGFTRALLVNICCIPSDQFLGLIALSLRAVGVVLCFQSNLLPGVTLLLAPPVSKLLSHHLRLRRDHQVPFNRSVFTLCHPIPLAQLAARSRLLPPSLQALT